MNNQIKKKKVKNIVLGIIDVFIVLIVIYFVIGYFNFFKISKEQKPVIDGVVTSYDKNGGHVTVHNYKIYKILTYIPKLVSGNYKRKLYNND